MIIEPAKKIAGTIHIYKLELIHVCFLEMFERT